MSGENNDDLTDTVIQIDKGDAMEALLPQEEGVNEEEEYSQFLKETGMDAIFKGVSMLLIGLVLWLEYSPCEDASFSSSRGVFINIFCGVDFMGAVYYLLLYPFMPLRIVKEYPDLPIFDDWVIWKFKRERKTNATAS